jgi:pyridoxine 5-phosphate synthase
VRVSLFVDPDPPQLEAAARLGGEFVELHTGAFANAVGEAQTKELDRLIAGARIAAGLGLKVNAGHGINYTNIRGILQMPHLVELNIGHSIIARALTVGMEAAVRQMVALMRQ